jgi:4'-phosphopantetheinyl transferase EntD
MAALFPDGVVTACAIPGVPHAPIHPLERAAIRGAGPARVRDFVAGRTCAREALAALGIHGYALLPGPDRAPLWPAGVVGSISHCERLCGVAVARRAELASIGLDVETSDPLPPDLLDLVCTRSERQRLRACDGADSLRLAKVLFSCKEATYKCYAPLGRSVLDFEELEIELGPTPGAFAAHLLNADRPGADGVRRFEGRYHVGSHYVLCGAVPSPRLG